MSTCPEKDIHSIYLDGELQDEFRGEYEAHIKNCAKCQAELSKLRKIKEILKADSNSIKVDNVFLEQSFNRLESRMRFNKVISQTKDTRRITLKTFVPAAVAAAAVFALMLPVRTIINSRASKNIALDATQETLRVVARQNSIPFSENNVVMNGNLTQVSFDTAGNVVNGVRARINSKHLYSTLTSLDVFRPEFGNSNIKISVPTILDINSSPNVQSTSPRNDFSTINNSTFGMDLLN